MDEYDGSIGRYPDIQRVWPHRHDEIQVRFYLGCVFSPVRAYPDYELIFFLIFKGGYLTPWDKFV